MAPEADTDVAQPPSTPTQEAGSTSHADTTQPTAPGGLQQHQADDTSSSSSGQTPAEQVAAPPGQDHQDTQTASPSSQPQEVSDPAALSSRPDGGDQAAAEELKAAGNKLYTSGQYEEAWQKYQDAIHAAPEDSPQLAIYWANSAACLLTMSQPKECVEACNHALAVDPDYKKALVRRATALEQLDELDRALQDAEQVLKLDGSDRWAADAVKRLRPVVDERNAKLKDEMVGKLKELGSTLLGKFGLSLDNFKAEQDPASGSYSIKFQQ